MDLPCIYVGCGKFALQRLEVLINFINLIISSKNKFMNGSIISIDGGIK